MVGSEDKYWYPTVDEIVAIHDNIIEEDPDSEPGIQDRDRMNLLLILSNMDMLVKGQRLSTKKHFTYCG